MPNLLKMLQRILTVRFPDLMAYLHANLNPLSQLNEFLQVVYFTLTGGDDQEEESDFELADANDAAGDVLDSKATKKGAALLQTFCTFNAFCYMIYRFKS